MEENVEYYVGMPVRIRETPESGGIVRWAPGMDKFCGMEATITYIDLDETFRLDVDDGDFWWDYKKVDPIRLSPDREIDFDANGFRLDDLLSDFCIKSPFEEEFL